MTETCEECKKLDREASRYENSWREQSWVNRRDGNRTKMAREDVERLKRAAEKAAAQAWLHKAECHPELGYTVTVKAIDVAFRH